MNFPLKYSLLGIKMYLRKKNRYRCSLVAEDNNDEVFEKLRRLEEKIDQLSQKMSGVRSYNFYKLHKKNIAQTFSQFKYYSHLCITDARHRKNA